MYPCFNESERFCEKPYAGKPHVQFCEGRVSKGICLLDFVNAFLKELEDNGIVYDLQDVNKLELPNIKLPWTE